jgi:hypothetical protein
MAVRCGPPSTVPGYPLTLRNARVHLCLLAVLPVAVDSACSHPPPPSPPARPGQVLRDPGRRARYNTQLSHAQCRGLVPLQVRLIVPGPVRV